LTESSLSRGIDLNQPTPENKHDEQQQVAVNTRRRSERGHPAFAIPAPALPLIYGAAIAAPLALASLSLTREHSFRRELCAGSGLVAFAMLALQFVSSGRFETLAGRIGIDSMMRWHQLAARTLAALVVLHPLLVVWPIHRLTLPMGLRSFWAILAEPSYRSGIAAWLVLLAIVLAGLLRRRLPVRYEAWRAMHALAGVAAIGLAAQHGSTLGRYSRHPAAGFYLYLMLAIAAGAFFFIYVARPLRLRAAPYRVRGKTKLAEDVWEVILEPFGKHGFDFAAGQFAWFSFHRNPLPALDHPFSIASPPARLPEIRILVKESGDFTRDIGGLAIGARAYIDGPHGNFTLHRRHGDSILLVAGGIGIAPVLSLLGDLCDRGDPRPITLIFAVRSEKVLICRDEIENLAARLDLRVSYVVDSPLAPSTGRAAIVDLAMIRSAIRCPRPEQCLAFLCGPTPMMLAVERHLSAVGIPPSQIVYERFVYD
jgi:predicted ferric reductase